MFLSEFVDKQLLDAHIISIIFEAVTVRTIQTYINIIHMYTHMQFSYIRLKFNALDFRNTSIKC